MAFQTLGQKYDSAVTVATLTHLAGLSNNAYWAMAAVNNNTTPPYADIHWYITLKTGASGVGTAGFLTVFGYGSYDGTHFTDGLAGTEGVVVPTQSGLNIFPMFIGSISVGANATSYGPMGPFAMAGRFGGGIPNYFGIIIQNVSGGTLDASTANFSVVYQGLWAQAG